MDNRRWDSSQIIAGGILDRPPPTSSSRPGLAKLTAHDSKEKVVAALKDGGAGCSQYYGEWQIWKTDKGFSGELFQYRAVTESFVDLPLDEAAERASDWLSGCAG